jgi:hypothetical protein
VHVVYGIGFTTLYFRNYYAAFPTELVRAAQIDGAGFFRIFWRIMLPSSGPIIVVCIIWQFTNIWNDFLFGASFADFDSQPMTVALNNLVNSSTGVKEYNVHFAGAIMAAALPNPARLHRRRPLLRARADAGSSQRITPWVSRHRQRHQILRRRGGAAPRSTSPSRRASSWCSSVRRAAASPRF